jgi:hypothetical protein
MARMIQADRDGVVARAETLSRASAARVVVGMPPSIRARNQLLPIVVVVIVAGFTLASAAASLLPPPHRPTLAEWRRDELAATVVQRRERIVELRLAGDHCVPEVAQELARLLVMDAQWATVRTFADDFEQRCGADPIVAKWRDAPRPRSSR